MIYIDNPYTDAWFNLAAEEYLLKNFSDDIFMLWQNEPSVIIGKHQNVWDEINRNYIQEKHIKVVRRYSGGGAVYHDSGNLNVTLIQNSKELASGTFTARLIAFLATFGIRAEADERQALTIDGLKISGSAQSIHKGRILHHATLLFSTDLYRLGDRPQKHRAEAGEKRGEARSFLCQVRKKPSHQHMHLYPQSGIYRRIQRRASELFYRKQDGHPSLFIH